MPPEHLPRIKTLQNFNSTSCLKPSHTQQSISASVKDTSVNGLEGLNINWEAPFKLDDYVVGFRYALGNIKKAPESLFAKRSYDTPVVEGSATVDVDYNLDSKVFAVESRWVSKKGKSKALVTPSKYYFSLDFSSH